jgi:hypothetical protein
MLTYSKPNKKPDRNIESATDKIIFIGKTEILSCLTKSFINDGNAASFFHSSRDGETIVPVQ